MSVTVHVWRARGSPGSGGNVGHGAMTCGTTYISWWPHAGGVGPGEALGQLVRPSTVRGAAERSLAVDIASEGQRMPSNFQMDDPLDEDAILAAWSDWQAIGTYNIAERSCCSCVYTLLRAGGLQPQRGRFYSVTPDVDFGLGRLLVSPHDLAAICAAARTRLRPERAPTMSARVPRR
jgi:hypothetical protein